MGRTGLNLTPSLLLPRCATMGKSLRVPELLGTHGSDRGDHLPLPEDLHRQTAKSLAQSRCRAGVRWALMPFPLCIPWVFPGTWLPRHPDRDAGTCCRGLWLRVDVCFTCHQRGSRPCTTCSCQQLHLQSHAELGAAVSFTESL